MLKLVQFSITLFLFLSHSAIGASDNHYAYPLENPYAATIIGTPQQFRANLPASCSLLKNTHLKFRILVKSQMFSGMSDTGYTWIPQIA